nr:unnamed protein product [Callosobruchus chinensis]
MGILNTSFCCGIFFNNNERISKLEDQIKSLSISNHRSEDTGSNNNSAVEESINGSARQVLELEREALELRRELQDARAKKEESDKKISQLDKKLSTLLRRNEAASASEDDVRTASSIESLSVITAATSTSSLVQGAPPKVILTGPVTDL